MCALVKFYKTATQPANFEPGGIYFNTTKHTITADGLVFGSRIKEITLKNNVLNVNHWDGEGDIEVTLPTEEYTKITHTELVKLRDAGELVEGRKYQITDYNLVLNKDGFKSADHPFDIIVEATSNSTLSENAQAKVHEGDTYFANCKLESWQLKYCVDNDTARFDWAVEDSTKEVIDTIEGLALDNLTVKYTETFIRMPKMGYEYYFDYDVSPVEDARDYNNGDYFIVRGFATFNSGERIPVIFGQGFGWCDHLYDKESPYFYVGKEEIDGVTYDKWHKYNIDFTTNLAGEYSYDLDYTADLPLYQKFTVYTKEIITNNPFTGDLTFTVPAIPINMVVYDVEGLITTEYYEITDTINGNQGFKDSYDAEYTIKELAVQKNMQNKIVAVLGYKSDPSYDDHDHIDKGECLEYIGKYPVNGVSYDTWERRGVQEDGSVYTSNTYTTPVLNATMKEVVVKGSYGVIYHMKDNFGNEAPFDFKNVMTRTVDAKNGQEAYKFTYSFLYDKSYDATTEPYWDESPLIDPDSGFPREGQTDHLWRNNVIKPYIHNYSGDQRLNSVVVECRSDYNAEGLEGVNNVFIGNNCDIIYITDASDNICIGDNCTNIIVKDRSDVKIGSNNTNIVLGYVSNFVIGDNNRDINIDNGSNSSIGSINNRIIITNINDSKIGDKNSSILSPSVENSTIDSSIAIYARMIVDSNISKCNVVAGPSANGVYVSTAQLAATHGAQISNSNISKSSIIHFPQILNCFISSCNEVRTPKLFHNSSIDHCTFIDCDYLMLNAAYLSKFTSLRSSTVGVLSYCNLENCMRLYMVDTNNSNPTKHFCISRSTIKNVYNVIIGKAALSSGFFASNPEAHLDKFSIGWDIQSLYGGNSAELTYKMKINIDELANVNVIRGVDSNSYVVYSEVDGVRTVKTAEKSYGITW